MRCKQPVLIGALILLFPGAAPAQLPFRLQAPDSEVAELARTALDMTVELGEINTTVGELGNVLTSKLEELPVFVDERGVKFAELSLNDEFTLELEPLPLRSALRKLLSPHGLRAVVEQEGLVITADFSILTRRGIATNRWIDVDAEFADRVEKVFNTPFSIASLDAPLAEVIAMIANDTKLPIVINARALEEIGLDSQQPVTLSLNDAALRSVLNLMLRQLDLTYILQNDVVEITTIEAAEQNLQNRIYWLEGTGWAVGDFQSLIDLIQTSIVPDTWEALGGPSTMAPVTMGTGNRPGILVSTIYPIHHRIDNLLQTLRDAHVGPDPTVVNRGNVPVINPPAIRKPVLIKPPAQKPVAK